MPHLTRHHMHIARHHTHVKTPSCAHHAVPHATPRATTRTSHVILRHARHVPPHADHVSSQAGHMLQTHVRCHHMHVTAHRIARNDNVTPHERHTPHVAERPSHAITCTSIVAKQTPLDTSNFGQLLDDVGQVHLTVKSTMTLHRPTSRRSRCGLYS